ncbi:glycosyltransferase family 4 protein [Acidisphaera sp. L21]|jgi:glycosyltransferase involved in cell wall biosynthesis|uniref:glycosyltransferase family 4 protein n=1 Tax=Acidisphaera sp. L21 TaxID=1641851 RepID=UPI00131CD7E4|nr:glycosyltransferase family 4 protein [Acidisphaera sp. L21]
MRVAITTVQVPFVSGGAELHASGLRQAIIDAGHEAEIVRVPFKWYPAPTIPQQILACRLLDLTESMGTRIDRVIGLKFPAYLIPHPNKVLWILHQHRGAYDMWDQHWGDLYGTPGGAEARDVIRSADIKLIPEARRIFANSRNVAARLRRFNGIDAEPLYHPPPLAERYHSGPLGEYLLMPSRFNATKRQSLVVEALALTRHPVHVVFIGGADDVVLAEGVMAKAGTMAPGRAQWLGSVSDALKIELLSEALAVLVPPLDEDYGYVALEAMLSSRAIITCTDSGGPLEFVEHGRNGLVCDPEPAALAEAMDAVWADRKRAKLLGEEGLAHYRTLGLTWEHAVQCLLD